MDNICLCIVSKAATNILICAQSFQQKRNIFQKNIQMLDFIISQRAKNR
jgi:hypothetical protein